MCENGKTCSTIPTHPRYHRIAHGEYSRALRDAFWKGVGTKLRGEARDLVPFTTVRRHIRNAHRDNLGVVAVEIDNIVGSSGRYRDFDVTYLPVREASDDRWVNIAQAHFEGVQLPPVMLYKIDDLYYVEDGNHRVSVARVLGHEAITAQVIELRDGGVEAAD